MTSYTRVRLPLRIHAQSALHIGTGFGLAQLLDDRTTRGPHPYPSRPGVRLPYIPGASLKGRLRFYATSLLHALAKQDHDVLIADLFGSAASPSRLTFPDAHLIAAEERAVASVPDGDDGGAGALLPYLALEERNNVALSRTRRAAREQMLLRMEVAAPLLNYTCAIHGWLPVGRDLRATALLVLAAYAATHIGGYKGRGLGAIRIELDPQDPPMLGSKRLEIDTIAEELGNL